MPRIARSLVSPSAWSVVPVLGLPHIGYAGEVSEVPNTGVSLPSR